MKALPDDIRDLKTGVSVKRELLSYSIEVPGLNERAFVLPDKQCVSNALFSVTERMLAIDKDGTKPPQPNANAIASLVPLAKKLGRITKHDNFCKKLDLLAYAEARPARTRRRYAKVVDQMVRAGCHDLDSLTTMGTTLKRISSTRYFIKFEGTLRKFGKLNVPRGINPRDPIYNVLLGRYLSHLEGAILKSFDKIYGHGDTMMKGKTLFEKARLVESYFKEGFWAYSLDMKRFDQHVNKLLLELEHTVYKAIHPDDDELAKLLRAQVHNKVIVKSTDGSFVVNNWTGRCSGDINTSLGNCILMGLMCKGLVSSEMRLMCDGDDTIIWAKPGTFDVDIAKRHFLKFGMQMTLESIATCPEELTFCQHSFVQTPEGVRMCRSPTKAMLRDVMSFGINGSDLVQFRKLLYAVGECGMSQYYGMPVLQAIYTMNLRLGLTSKTKTFRELSRSNFGMGLSAKREAVPIDAATRVSFWKATGYSPAEQVRIEEWCEDFELTEEVKDVGYPEWYEELLSAEGQT
jgi:hypothetical protein